MQQQGVVPDAITYSAWISACEKSTWPDQAMEIFAAMEKQSVEPNAITYSVLTSACEKGF